MTITSQPDSTKCKKTFTFFSLFNRKFNYLSQKNCSSERALLDRIATSTGDSESALSTADSDWFADKPVILYRVGDCVGLAPSNTLPLINSTSQIGRFAMTAVGFNFWIGIWNTSL